MNIFSKLFRKLLKNKIFHVIRTKNLYLYIPATCDSIPLEDQYKNLEFSAHAIQKLINDYSFETVLDIGAGAMDHSKIFAKNNKKVTAIDFGVSVYYKKYKVDEQIEIEQIFGNFNTLEINRVFDCVWASHILEHQPNVETFLKKVISLTKEGGVIAITVPPFKHEIVGGHISLWNAGLILYRLVLCGVDCSKASILSYGYNISVIVEKKTITLPDIEYDCGDIRRIKQYLPNQLLFSSNENDDPFNGNISRINW